MFRRSSTSSVSSARPEGPTDAVFRNAVRSMKTTHKPLLMLRAKVAVVGDACTGKTAITQMFHSGGHNYPKSYVMTIGVDYVVQQVPIPDSPDSAVVELHLFDCAGQSVFNQLGSASSYWNNASLACLVYDVSNRESFESCGKWLRGVRGTRPSNSAPVPGVLIANKADLRDADFDSRAVVDTNEGMRFAKENDLEYFEVSALTGYGVQAPFQHMAQQFYRMYQETMRNAERVADQAY
ncbi:unnamed protein product [Chrysoparadoxa australica]